MDLVDIVPYVLSLLNFTIYIGRKFHPYQLGNNKKYETKKIALGSYDSEGKIKSINILVHAIKVYRESRGIAPLYISLSTRRR